LNAPGDFGPIDLAGVAVPAHLTRPARLYAAVVDQAGALGPRRFLAELPEGAAIFALAATGVVFLLVEGANAAAAPLLAAGPIDAPSIDAWYGALLSCPGMPRSDGDDLPLEPGDRRTVAAGARLTARGVVWLEAAAPILRYAAPASADASSAVSLLAMADQVGAEVVGDGAVSAVDTASLLARLSPAELGASSAAPAARIARILVESDTAEHQRWQKTLALDETQASRALQRLRDIAAFRQPAIVPASLLGGDALAGALAVIAATEGFELRPPTDDDRDAPLFERLGCFANATGFRFREIALGDDWWTEEGPAFLGIATADARPLALVWRRSRWRAVDPQTLAETAIDRTAAASLMSRGYMIYAALPERLTMWELWRFAVFGVRGDIVRLLAASAAATLAGLLLPVATGAVLGTAVPDGRMTLLYDMLLLLVAAAIGGACFQVVRAAALIRLGTHVDRRLQSAIWDRVIRLRTSFFRGYSVGDLALRILGVDAIRRILSGVTVDGVISGVFSLASLGVMLIYDASLAAFAVGYGVVAALLLFVLGRQQMRLQRIVYQRKGIVSGLLIEILGGIAKLRVAAAELRAFSRWSGAFAEQRANDARSGRLSAFQTVAATSLPILGALGIFAIAAGGAQPIDVASFAAFNSAFGQFTAAILGLAAALNASIEAVPLFARVRPVFEAPLEVEQSRIDPGRLAGQLAVRNLSFRYAEDTPWILDDIDFEVRPGESVAIVGASGSGKSTLLRLLLGFESPARGGVYYDGKDLEKLDLRLVRRQIGTVLETAGLIPGSIYENIAGSAPLTREQVMEAVRLAGLDADIAAMPMGLESFIMEGGSQISGGQRQRVMIARALVRKPRLIFFDEATSALDNRTQAIVGESIAAMNATRIVIAHRLSTIRTADRILVLERGRIVETGTYDELVARDGVFHRLAQRQLL
jgi:NHLM bacteriocin system ABC transporter ATP-binding protein